jgi:hypothetical protein
LSQEELALSLMRIEDKVQSMQEALGWSSLRLLN